MMGETQTLKKVEILKLYKTNLIVVDGDKMAHIFINCSKLYTKILRLLNYNQL